MAVTSIRRAFFVPLALSPFAPLHAFASPYSSRLTWVYPRCNGCASLRLLQRRAPSTTMVHRYILESLSGLMVLVSKQLGGSDLNFLEHEVPIGEF